MAIIKGLKKLVKDNEEQINLAIKNKNFQDIRNDAEFVGADPEQVLKLSLIHI